jgi:catechol 2,3-dioxygenase-like lactoylglutathione lyase family enzyme
VTVRLDHVSVIVEDLDSAVAFFAELGLELEGSMPVEGPWVDRVNGMADVRVEIAMMRTPDGHGKLELTTFHSPGLVATEPDPAPVNTLGLRTVMFEVDDIDDAVARLARHGGQLIGEIARYEDVYRLCYLRGPAGMIVALAESLG